MDELEEVLGLFMLVWVGLGFAVGVLLTILFFAVFVL